MEEKNNLNNNEETNTIENLIPNNTHNPLLARVEMPGATFTLPSRGIFYNNGELSDDVEMGEVNVRPMAAYDEILFKSPDELFSGRAIEKVFKRCIPQVKKPLELLAKDIDFLLVCLQHVTFGDEKEYIYKHDCENAKEHSYMVNISKFINETKAIDPTIISSSFSLTLDNGQVVKLQPIRFNDLLKIYQIISTKDIITVDDDFQISLQTVLSIIESVDGVTDKEMISQWLQEIPTTWFQKISETIDKISDFGTSTKYNIKCKDCNQIVEIDVPLNPIAFFT